MARGIWRRRRGKGKPSEIWVVYKDPQGVRRREKLGPDTPEVLRAAKDFIARKQLYLPVTVRPAAEGKRLAFRELGENYWRLLGAQKSKTWLCMLELLYKYFGNRLAAEITTKDIQAYYNWKLRETSASTANRNLTLIKTVYNRAVAWGDYAGANPTAGVQRRPENPSRLRYLSLKEMEAFLSVCRRPEYARLYPLVVCALFTGMRRGEILAMDWQNINLESRTIYILHSKSGKPREIPIADKFSEVLGGLGPKTAGPVFEIPDITFRRLFERAKVAARLPEFRFHDLRHTFASHFAMKTGDMLALQRILGHASPQMTQRYAHLSRAHLDAAIRQFDTVMPAMGHEPYPNPPAGYRPVPAL